MREARAARGNSLVWWGLLLGACATLLTAAWLKPDPSGYGTHTQLGLPPCGFVLLTGMRCPGCGLTTAFSHMVRLEPVQAFVANPLGVLLFVGVAACIPLCVVAIARRWTLASIMRSRMLETLATLMVITAALTFVIRGLSDL